MKKSKRKTLRNKLDKVFSDYIRSRDQCCVTCGAIDNLQCSHFISRRFLATRWMGENVHLQCVKCHMAYEHHESKEYDRWMRETYGQAWIDELEFQRQHIAKYTDAALEGMIAHYQEKIKEKEAA